MDTPSNWKPLVRAVEVVAPSEADLSVAMTSLNTDRAGAMQYFKDEWASNEYYVNEIYQVQVKRVPGQSFVHLNIARKDGKAIIRDWRHIQQIKNEVLGPECEAVELYPAESRKVDTANKYHLFGSVDPDFRFTFGFRNRDVDYETHNADNNLMKQRRL